jgi:hypothetical protein
MGQLQPVLDLIAAGETSGRAVFEAFQATQPLSPRPVVATVRMDTGYLTNQLDEGKVLAAVLHTNRSKGLERGLDAIVQLKIDTDARQLVWGLATYEAVTILENTYFQIPTKEGSQRFQMVSSHALDGFHAEIVGFAVDRDSQAHLWEVLGCCGAMPISGQYVNTSKAFGATGSRYRVSFQGNDVPAVFKKDGRLLDEIVFMGKLYRIYPKGWFAHRDRRFIRGDLDQYARDLRVSAPAAQATKPAPARRATTDTKRQRVDPDPAGWTYVTKGAAAGSQGQPRAWQSANIYTALDSQLALTTRTVYSADRSDVTIVPAITRRPDAPAPPTSGEFVGGTKTRANQVVRVETSLTTLLNEFAALDAASMLAATKFQASCEAASVDTRFVLADYIKSGEADWIQRDLEVHPIAFRRQLQDLALTEPELLLPLVQLRMLCRWLRASVGATQRFHALYKTAFGHDFSLVVLADDYARLSIDNELRDSYDPAEGGTSAVTPIATESVVALSELVLGSVAPLIYTSDAAICAVTAKPVFSIPSRTNSRYLSTSTICDVLWGNTLLGAAVRDSVSSLLAAAIEAAAHAAALVQGYGDVDMCTGPVDDATVVQLQDCRSCLRAMDALVEFGDLGVGPDNQVVYDPSAGTLAHGDLRELWSEVPLAAPRC